VFVLRNLWSHYEIEKAGGKGKGPWIWNGRATAMTLTDGRLAFLRQLWTLPLLSLSVPLARQFLSLQTINIPVTEQRKHRGVSTNQRNIAMGFPLENYCTHSTTRWRSINTHISTAIIVAAWINTCNDLYTWTLGSWVRNSLGARMCVCVLVVLYISKSMIRALSDVCVCLVRCGALLVTGEVLNCSC
jgi:hypothetical protein